MTDLEPLVDAALCRLEERMGTTHPLRRIPVDLIAEAVAKEVGGLDATDAAIDGALVRIADRNRC